MEGTPSTSHHHPLHPPRPCVSYVLLEQDIINPCGLSFLYVSVLFLGGGYVYPVSGFLFLQFPSIKIVFLSPF